MLLRKFATDDEISRRIRNTTDPHSKRHRRTTAENLFTNSHALEPLKLALAESCLILDATLLALNAAVNGGEDGFVWETLRWRTRSCDELNVPCTALAWVGLRECQACKNSEVRPAVALVSPGSYLFLPKPLFIDIWHILPHDRKCKLPPPSAPFLCQRARTHVRHPAFHLPHACSARRASVSRHRMHILGLASRLTISTNGAAPKTKSSPQLGMHAHNPLPVAPLLVACTGTSCSSLRAPRPIRTHVPPPSRPRVRSPTIPAFDPCPRSSPSPPPPEPSFLMPHAVAWHLLPLYGKAPPAVHIANSAAVTMHSTLCASGVQKLAPGDRIVRIHARTGASMGREQGPCTSTARVSLPDLEARKAGRSSIADWQTKASHPQSRFALVPYVLPGVNVTLRWDAGEVSKLSTHVEPPPATPPPSPRSILKYG
ncbi:hypothetical protein MVEN_01171000 [Mycena venus]|uniref:Uncharacterized protein n=1 Tax=Mycena venus TaxID=2733690 RepID=A0A8H6Y3M8_9AGAR|nr:hypothetical protein MVEN_01171000 [Mycena venus]